LEEKIIWVLCMWSSRFLEWCCRWDEEKNFELNLEVSGVGREREI
jgi:hypothetical protein